MKGIQTALLAATAIALAFVLSRLPPNERIQVASGDDALSVAFGGAKKAVSQVLYQRTDSYFHGGVDMDSTYYQAHPDPWSWINARIRAPQVERHLEGAKSVEMMPWFWAAVKADPENVEAWASAWYVATHIMGNQALAARILDEGQKANPDSLELAFCRARFVYDNGRGGTADSESAFATAREVGLRLCGGDLARLAEKDGDTYLFIIGYLADFAERRREHDTLVKYLGEVEKIKTKTPIADTIRARIRRLAK